MAEFPTLEDIFEPIEGKSGTEANEQMRKWYTGTRQLPGAAPSEPVSIVDDVIAPTSADVIVDTEGQAPADDLQIIQTGSTHDGMILSLRAANPDRAITVRATGQLNGITLWNRGERYILSTTERLVLQRDGNVWREVRGIGLALAADSELTLENTDMAARASQLASLYFRTATLEGGIASIRPTSADAGKIPMVDSVGGFALSNAIADRIDISQQVMHVQDQKPNGTHGGSFAGGNVWRVRDINTVIENTIPGSSLANNQITLPAGRYEIHVEAPAYAVGANQAALYNVTDVKYYQGINSMANVSYNGFSLSVANKTLSISSATVFEVRHIGQSTSTAGFGPSMGVFGLTITGNEIYTNVFIRRLA